MHRPECRDRFHEPVAFQLVEEVIDGLRRVWPGVRDPPNRAGRSTSCISCSPVRLRDGRLLALECKVSNGPKNSWKRVNREVGGKSEGWRQQFGVMVVTGVVLAGVYDLACLKTAQDNQRVAIFWEHDLSPLADFVTSVT